LINSLNNKLIGEHFIKENSTDIKEIFHLDENIVWMNIKDAKKSRKIWQPKIENFIFKHSFLF
jgi:hypothetical protein